MADDTDPEYRRLQSTAGFDDLTQVEKDERFAARLFMKDAYSASAADWAHFGSTFDEHAVSRGKENTGARMRQVGEHLFGAASRDVFTDLQNGLAGSSDPKSRRSFGDGGGFIAKQKEIVTTRRNPQGVLQVAGGQGGSKSLEFHPPGGTHVPGDADDLHGSYVRPKGGRGRALSIGVGEASGSGAIKLDDRSEASSAAVAKRLSSMRGHK